VVVVFFRKYNFGQKQKIYTIKTGHIINSKSISNRETRNQIVDSCQTRLILLRVYIDIRPYFSFGKN